MNLLTETCTLRARRKVGEDRYNNDVFEWDEAAAPCWFEQRNGSEADDSTAPSVANGWLYLPLTTPLPMTAVSEVLYDDRRWQVDGEPGRQPGGFIVEGYQLVALKKVS